MNTITLSTKGQFTINKTLMEHMGVRGGEKIQVTKTPDGGLKIMPDRSKGSLMDLACSIKTDVHLTDEELEECIADCYAEAGMQGLEE
ncbi:MAG: AbrB/MazE/SpoVT family DNA-binding domain-containing protein [Zoogloeaceae bacterium]|jgi:bifunctional DNA-binding transcriptional regulator/antitoxin component of YhaV-PrlF toxin-antitoxin module|nr:AbrB/MazE/SpoVT family DNA-binding domain-containing protein [Zoogloeaceae bacterium]